MIALQPIIFGYVYGFSIFNKKFMMFSIKISYLDFSPPKNFNSKNTCFANMEFDSEFFVNGLQNAKEDTKTDY